MAGAGIHRDEFEREVGSGVTGQVFTYDGANRTGAHQYNGSAWLTHGYWLYDGMDHPLEHVDETGARQYYEVDLVGNVRRLVAAGGADLGGYRYTAFGETYVADSGTPAPTGAASLPVRWKGRWLEYSTGGIDFYDMRARWWVPQLGVFVTHDSFGADLGYLAGLNGDPTAILSLPLGDRSSASIGPIQWLGVLPALGSQLRGPSLGAFPYFDPKTTVWGWPGQNPNRWADPAGHDPSGLDNPNPPAPPMAPPAEMCGDPPGKAQFPNCSQCVPNCHDQGNAARAACAKDIDDPFYAYQACKDVYERVVKDCLSACAAKCTPG